MELYLKISFLNDFIFCPMSIYYHQLYAQCVCLREMGYKVNQLKLYSYDDNKNYNVDLPEKNTEMNEIFIYLQSYYRAFVREKNIEEFPFFDFENKDE